MRFDCNEHGPVEPYVCIVRDRRRRGLRRKLECPICKRLANFTWWIMNKERKRATSKAWYYAHTERARENQRRYRASKRLERLGSEIQAHLPVEPRTHPVV